MPVDTLRAALVPTGVILERVLQQGVLAADLVPWWFAAAFWLAFVVLVVMVVRDVRRAGGVRRVWDAVQASLDSRAQQGEPAPHDAGPDGDAPDPREIAPLSGDEDPPRPPR
jgi:hypothetical protein